MTGDYKKQCRDRWKETNANAGEIFQKKCWSSTESLTRPQSPALCPAHFLFHLFFSLTR